MTREQDRPCREAETTAFSTKQGVATLHFDGTIAEGASRPACMGEHDGACVFASLSPENWTIRCVRSQSPSFST